MKEDPTRTATMTPSHELLNRIRWDPAFAKGRFVLGYYDRVDKQIVKLPLARIEFASDSHCSFEAIAADGSVHSVPFHRVREVYRDGELIWHRPAPPLPHHH